MTTNQTSTETLTGDLLFVECDEDAQAITFFDEDVLAVAAYTFDIFAAVDGALALDLGRDMVISGDEVATLQAWADLDAFGQRRRQA